MSEQHPLDPYAELIGKVSPEKIAETAGVELATVEAWLAEREEPEPEAKPKAKTAEPKQRKRAEAKPVREAAPRRIEAIRVLRTTAIAIENRRGQRLRISVPRSIFRGELARKYAQLLREDEFRVIEYSR